MDTPNSIYPENITPSDDGSAVGSNGASDGVSTIVPGMSDADYRKILDGILNYGTTPQSAQAALRWCQAKQRCKKPRTMSPMDEMTWFGLPRCTYPRIDSQIPAPLVLANPQRVMLMLTTSNSLNVLVGPCADIAVAVPDPANPGMNLPASAQGILLLATNALLTITYKEHGPLVQSTWYGITNDTPGVTITCIEMILKDWPG